MSPAPAKKHQLLVLSIGSELAQKTQDCPLCDVLIVEDWKLESSTVLKPDISLVCADSNPNYISKTPEIIFKVLSPSTASHDEGLKFQLYENAAVQFYVLVYPDDLIARIYRHDGNTFRKAAECDTDQFIFDGISCQFKFVNPFSSGSENKTSLTRRPKFRFGQYR